MRKFCVVAVLAVTALAIGACGSNDDSGGGGASTAGGSATSTAAATGKYAKVLDDARKPISAFPGPTESPGPIPKGKKLAVVYIISSPFPDNLNRGLKAATAAVGWSMRTYNSQGTPTGMQSALSTALASKPDALVLAAMPAALLQQQIKRAKAANIPVVALSPGMPDDLTPEKANLVNQVQYDRHVVGKVLADWVLDQWPDGATALSLTSPEFVDLQAMSEEFRATIEAAGPNFKAPKPVASPVTDTGGGQGGVSRLATPMRSNPDAKAIFINSESWFSTFLKASKVASGGSKIVGLGADGDVSIPLVKDGAPIVMMGSDSTTYGWYSVDSLARYWNKKPQPVYKVPLRLVDSKNASSIDTEGIRVSFDNAAEWKKLWGLG